MVRGDVHAIKLPRGRGHVQYGPRYAVIVQADELLALSTAVVCPTSASVPPATFHPEVELDGRGTRVLCEMVAAVDASRLGERVAHLSVSELASVEDALSLVLELAVTLH